MTTVQWICERVSKLARSKSPKARAELKELLARALFEQRNIDRELERRGIKVTQ